MTKRLEESLVLVRKGLGMRSNTVASAIFEGMNCLFSELTLGNNGGLPDDAIAQYADIMFHVADFAESTRVNAAEATLAMAMLSRQSSRLSALFKGACLAALERERSYSVQQILRKAVAELTS